MHMISCGGRDEWGGSMSRIDGFWYLIVAGGALLGWLLTPATSPLALRLFAPLVGAGVAWSLPLVLRLVANILDALWPSRPDCETGRCSQFDYITTAADTRSDEYECQCRCGTTYRYHDHRFEVKGADGRFVPFRLRKHRWSAWRKDVSQSEPFTSR